MTDADLARWEDACVEAVAVGAADVPIMRAEATLALIVEVRRLRAEPRLEITVEEIRTALDGLALAEHALETLAAENERLRALLREVEWASTIWTDTATCPFCGGLRDRDLPHIENQYAFQPKGHRPGCAWVAALGATLVAAR